MGHVGVSTWFMCKLCTGELFPNLDLFIEHKRSSHMTRFQKIKRIVFEEKAMYLDNEDCGSSSSSSGSSNYEDALDHVSAIDFVPCNSPAEHLSNEDKNQEMMIESKINSEEFSHRDQQVTHIDIDAGMYISGRKSNVRTPDPVTDGIKSPSRFNPFVSLKRLSSKYIIQSYSSGLLRVNDSKATSVSSSTAQARQECQESKIHRFSLRTPKPVDTSMKRKLRSTIKDPHEGSRSDMDDEIRLNKTAGVQTRSRSVSTVFPVVFAHPVVLIKRLTSREIEDALRGRLDVVSIPLS